MGQGEFGLTSEERRAYDADGFFARERAFGADEIEALRQAAERVVATAESSAPDQYCSEEQLCIWRDQRGSGLQEGPGEEGREWRVKR